MSRHSHHWLNTCYKLVSVLHLLEQKVKHDATKSLGALFFFFKIVFYYVAMAGPEYTM